MPSKILFLLICISFLIPMLAAGQHSNRLNLTDYKWQNRLLLVFTPAQESDLYEGQMQGLSGKKEGLIDRDMKIFHLINAGASHIDEKSIDKTEMQRIQTEYKVKAQEFTAILIGKDGTEKLRTHSILTTDKLFAVIDAMPMRKREMRQ